MQIYHNARIFDGALSFARASFLFLGKADKLIDSVDFL